MRRRALAGLAAALWLSVCLSGCLNRPDTAHSDDEADRAAGPINHLTPLDAVVARQQVRPLDPGAATPLLDQAMTELAKTDPAGRYRGITYDLTKDNALGPDWLIQTPNAWGKRSSSVGYFPVDCKAGCDPDFRLPFCTRDQDCRAPGSVCGHLAAFDASPALAGKRLCLGHSDAVVDRFYRPIVAARRAVDITLLQPVPDYRFLAALRNAVTMLARSRREITMRVLVGQYPPETDAKALLGQLVRDARTVPGARLTIYASAMRSCSAEPSCGSASWNHAKIVVADGKDAVVGGHNMWSLDYLVDEPVHDITMELHGGAAANAHLFADALWGFVCGHAMGATSTRTKPVTAFVYRSGTEGVWRGCLASIRTKINLPPRPAGAGGVPMLASARLAAGITDDFANQDDLARDLVFGAARHSIKVAQQDVAFNLPGQPQPLYPESALRAWTAFMLAGRGDVYLVLSNLHAESRSKFEYSNGIPIEAVAQKMLQVAQAHSTLPRPELVDLLCRHFHLAPLRFGPDPTWPGNHPIGNHGKFWMVDDRYFYIGSDNLYPVDLQEFGYILDDRAAAAALRRDYWDPLWRWSKSAAISGEDAPSCVLRGKPTS
jgi:Phospholipase D Active site motif